MRTSRFIAPSLAACLSLSGCSLILKFEPCGADTDCDDERSCVEGRCLTKAAGDLLSPDFCHAIYPSELENEVGTDQVILLGTLLPISGGLSSKGPSRERAVYMAVDEINSSGGVNGRKIAVLSCDSGTDAVRATEAAQFMAQTAQIPAVVGCASSAVTIAAFTDAARANGMMIISPSSTSVLITSLADDGLLWRTAPSDAGQGVAIAELIADRGYQKIGVVSRDDAYGNSLRDVMQDVLCERIDCEDADAYVSRSYADDSLAVDQSQAVVAIEDLDPDAIVAIGFVEDIGGLLRLLRDSNTLSGKPIILTDGAKDVSLIEELADPGFLSQVFGTNPASPNNRNSRTFVINYRAKWDEEPTSFTPHSYDAAYLLAYALATLGEGTVSGAAIAEGMGKLSSGDLVDVGPGSFALTASKLASPGATVDVSGASGSLDFDPATGEALGDIEGWQFNAGEGEIDSLGVIYDSASRQFIPPNPPDAGVDDGGSDAGVMDTGTADAGMADTGTTAADAG